MRLRPLIVLMLCCRAAVAQTPPSSSKLAFLIPNLFGPNGLTLPNPNHEAHFDSAFQANFGPFNTALASQLTSLPIPSPASGFTYSFDKSTGAYTRSAQSFGPILAERAETLGKDRFFAGFSVQNFRFDRIDGLDLARVPVLFRHSPAPATPEFEKDLITTDNFVGLEVRQFTSFFSYGLTDRIDVSVAVPVIRTSLSVVSNAVIQRIGTANDPNIHFFNVTTGDRTKATFAAAGNASGIGDVILRLKGSAWKWPSGAFALGADLRLPTGDEYDFLGSGALGVRPFAALSFRSRAFSPHLNLGYQWNDKTVLAGDIRTGAKGHLPNQVTWAAGFDWGASQKLTVAFDLLGQHVRNSRQVAQTTLVAADQRRFQQIEFRKASFEESSGAIGFKLNPVGKLLVSFNLLFRLNDAGLHSRVTPLVGLSYAF